MVRIRRRQFIPWSSALLCAQLSFAACDAASRRADEPETLLARRSDSARHSAARAWADSINRAQPGYIIDSILPVGEEIRRFQATLENRPQTLSGGAADQASLVRAFVDAVERRDERALRRLVVDRAEFGYLIYPDSPNTKPPYRLSPDLVWLQHSAATEKGIARVFDRFGGRRLELAGYVCEATPQKQGQNRVWGRCVVRLPLVAGGLSELRLFGPIVERRGLYKFLSLTSGL